MRAVKGGRPTRTRRTRKTKRTALPCLPSSTSLCSTQPLSLSRRHRLPRLRLRARSRWSRTLRSSSLPRLCCRSSHRCLPCYPTSILPLLLPPFPPPCSRHSQAFSPSGCYVCGGPGGVCPAAAALCTCGRVLDQLRPPATMRPVRLASWPAGPRLLCRLRPRHGSRLLARWCGHRWPALLSTGSGQCTQRPAASTPTYPARHQNSSPTCNRHPASIVQLHHAPHAKRMASASSGRH